MSALTAKAMVQEAFLEHLHQSAEAVTVFLVNGVKLQGVVADFDADSILLRRDGHIQLVYKHAMSTIMPVASLSNFIIEFTASPAVAAGDF